MDFELDEDQHDLQTAAAETLAKACPATYLRSVVEDGHEPTDLWQTLTALDWPVLAIPERDGGAGATAMELAIVLEQLGYVGDPTPFLATTTQLLPVVLAAGDDAQRARFAGAVAAGATGTLALADVHGRWDASSTPISASPSAGGWELRGTAHHVVDGDRVDEIAVLARTPEGPRAFVVARTAVRTERLQSLDPFQHTATVTFDGATVDDDRRLAGDGTAAFSRALDDAAAGLAMVMVGAGQRALDIVLDYVKRREQFGVPVGSFQAVKHKAVDVHIAVERARALAYFAALTAAEEDPRRSIAASMAKAAAGDMQNIAFRHCIQLFGGLGFTWENDVHLYLRRAKAGELLFGGAREHRGRVGRELLTGPQRPHEVVHAAKGGGTLLSAPPEAPKGAVRSCG